MNDHPPIPPNCELDIEYAIENSLDFGYYDPKFKRIIIASVARCAWTDESKRLDWDFNKRAFGPKEGIGADMQRMCDSVESALDNAEAWRKWGASK